MHASWSLHSSVIVIINFEGWPFKIWCNFVLSFCYLKFCRIFSTNTVINKSISRCGFSRSNENDRVLFTS